MRRATCPGAGEGAGLARGQGGAGGFTLLEVLVAITILGIVMAGTYAAVVQTRTSIQSAEASLEASEAGYQSVALLAQLLESAYTAKQRPDLVFSGASRGRGAESADSLRFVAAAGGYFPLPGPPGDLVECHIQLLVQPDRRRLLVLEVGPASLSDPRQPAPGLVLSTELGGLDLSFWTSEGWIEDFDPAVWSGLPGAVRIRVYRDGVVSAARIVVPALAEEFEARRIAE
jgi:prepilin-type N-terminal cleavage/methylation domain-containing protein